MGRVVSADGTPIAYERLGSGPAVLLVGGGLDDGAENAPLAAHLADRFTVYNYARRGRGGSGDTAPYAVDREVEDIAALVALADGPVCALGVSSGGGLALEAAAAGVAFDRLAVYEVPYLTDDGTLTRWRAYVRDLDAALAAGRRDQALVLFMRVAGSTEEDIAGARRSPLWAPLEAIAHTLAYDAACLGDGRPRTDLLARVAQPTLVVTGADDPFFAPAADALVRGLPRGSRRTLGRQGHVADPAVLAPALARFFQPAT